MSSSSSCKKNKIYFLANTHSVWCDDNYAGFLLQNVIVYKSFFFLCWSMYDALMRVPRKNERVAKKRQSSITWVDNLYRFHLNGRRLTRGEVINFNTKQTFVQKILSWVICVSFVPSAKVVISMKFIIYLIYTERKKFTFYKM